jgi:hypothetical protein|tara:strand:+ start:5311 stop:6735 length:1425 start_codon:yes stop_codon:yes gene_type:complete
MNLKDIRDYVSNILDYNPDVTAYKNEVNDVINQVLLMHFMERPWEYAQKNVRLSVKKDVTFTSSQAEIQSGSGVYNGAVKVSSLIANWINFEMVVQITESFTGDSNGTVYPANKEFIVVSRYEAGGATYLYLRDPDFDPRYYNTDAYMVDGPSSNTSSAITVKHRKVTLPGDCLEVLSVGMRGLNNNFRQPFESLSKFYDENLSLNLDLVARPTEYIHIEPLMIQGPKRTPSISIGGLATGVPKTGTYGAAYSFSPVGPWDAEIVKPQSAPIYTGDATFTAGQSMTVVDLEVTDQAAPWNRRTGLNKRIWIRQPDSNKHYQLSTGTVDVEESSTATSLATTGCSISESDKTSRPVLDRNSDGIYPRIRLFPRQDDNYDLHLRYQYRPLTMLDDDDVPMMPKDTHLYLCYVAISELFLKHGDLNQGTVYEKKAQKELLKIENRYLQNKTQLHVKAPFKATGGYTRRRMVKITRVT